MPGDFTCKVMRTKKPGLSDGFKISMRIYPDSDRDTPWRVSTLRKWED